MENGQGYMFKKRLVNETKTVILYILKELPSELKTIIIDEIDIYLDDELNDLESYEEETYWYRDEDLYFNNFKEYFSHLQLKNYLESPLDYDSYPDTD